MLHYAHMIGPKHATCAQAAVVQPQRALKVQYRLQPSCAEHDSTVMADVMHSSDTHAPILSGAAMTSDANVNIHRTMI